MHRRRYGRIPVAAGGRAAIGTNSKRDETRRRVVCPARTEAVFLPKCGSTTPRARGANEDRRCFSPTDPTSLRRPGGIKRHPGRRQGASIEIRTAARRARRREWSSLAKTTYLSLRAHPKAPKTSSGVDSSAVGTASPTSNRGSVLKYGDTRPPRPLEGRLPTLQRSVNSTRARARLSQRARRFPGD